MLNNNRSTYLNNGATLVIRSDEVFRNCLDVISTSIYVGRTGVSRTRILRHRSHDGGAPIIGDGDGLAEIVKRLFIRRLDFLLLRPRCA